MITSEYSSSSSSETDVDQAHEYYEEVDNHTLNFQKRKVPASKPTPIPTKSFVKERAPASPPPPVIDPIQKLNEQLNRKFRPDLVPPSPPPPPIPPEPIVKRTPTPNPIIFDARTKSIKTPKKKQEPLFNLKEKLFNRNHQSTDPTTTSTPSKLVMSQQPTTNDNYQVPPGMMLVPAPQQQTQPNVSQYKPPTLTYSTSVKTNKVAPPPSAYNNHTGNHGLPINSLQSPSSLVSTNHLIQSSYALKQQQQQQQQENLFKHIDQTKSSKKKQKKKTDDNLTSTQNGNRAFALYNQKNGRIEGVVKNRLNVATDDVEESRMLDDETEPRSKWALWLSQPLCLGLTRLSGGVLFGSMILLGCASIAGLIASIVLYSQDSVTDAQWKILGIVVCAIMLITIIITLLIFVCCYKHGYMFDKDDDIDGADPSTTQDAEGNARQKAFLRKIYKFNRPNDTSSIPSNIPHNVSTSPLMSQPTINVTDKQTNTEATIAVIRPKDLNRGVWPSMNAYGGISYRPLIQPQMVSRFIQVLPHEIEQTMQPQQVIYQVVAPAAAIPPQQIQSRIIQIPAEQSSSDFLQYIETTQQQQQQPRTIQIPVQQQQIVEYVQTTQRQQQPRTIQIPAQQPQTIEYVETTQRQQPRTIQIPAQQQQTIEYVETTQRQQPRMIQIPAPQSPLVEYIETTQKQQPRTTIIRQPQTQQIVVQPSTRIEYVDSEDQQTHRIVQQPTTRIEYVNAKDQRTHRNVQQPQYEIVEEIIDRSSPSPMDEYVEVVDAPKHGRHREKKKDKKRGFGKIIVKHIRSDND